MPHPATPTHNPDSSAPLYLVSCVSKKLLKAAPARTLYTSPWFLKARRHVEAAARPWFVLSAAHGLLHPDRVVAPYDLTLRAMPPAARRAWAARVLDDLEVHLGGISRLVLFAGKLYREHLVPALEARGCALEVPLAGLAIGKQLAWFDAHRGERS